MSKNMLHYLDDFSFLGPAKLDPSAEMKVTAILFTFPRIQLDSTIPMKILENQSSMEKAHK